jgi:hypothetical protein
MYSVLEKISVGSVGTALGFMGIAHVAYSVRG